MGDKTQIEWTDATWNPVTGCTKVSSGCKNCYAERIFHRLYPGRVFTDVRCHPDRLDLPLHWRKPRRIFVNSMSDLFHKDVPLEFIDSVWRIMIRAKHHVYQILTKRPARMLAYVGSFRDDGDGWMTRNGRRALGKTQSGPLIAGYNWPPKNLWLGVSVEDQATADDRIRLLLRTPAALRFVSYEPALGPIDFNAGYDQDWNVNYLSGLRECPFTDIVTREYGPKLNWVIAGGESGPNARPSHPDWFRSARDQCAAAGVPFFFKQWGEWADRGTGKTIDVEDPGKPLSTYRMVRAGKKAAGHLLDGREHSEYPPMHDCVNCGCACYCHGDIDDCQVETIEYAYMHCVGCGCEEDGDGDFYDDDEEIGDIPPPGTGPDTETP